MQKSKCHIKKENEFKNLRIAVVHDHLGWSGGGERTSLIIAQELGADFITAHASSNTFSDYQKRLGEKLIILSKKVVNKEVIRFFWLRNLFRKNKKLLAEYDVLIASGHAATEAVANYANSKATKILYNHTPPRRIFDLYKESKNRYKWFLRPLFVLFAIYWRYIYIRAAQKIDFNIANSKNIAKRTKKYTQTEVNAIIWPPILTKKFQFIAHGEYFISWARNDENKRVELIVKAFQKMPDKKLIIASGGNRFDKIKELAAGYKNINVLGWVSDEELFDLVGNSQAAIYIPRDEDAGMTQLEANAAGKPVLGVAEGGLVETIIDNKTGILVKKNPQVADIISGVKKMTKEWCINRRRSCIKHAKKYSKEKFALKIKKVIENNDSRVPVIGIDASRWENPQYPGEHKRTGVEEYSYNLIKNIVNESKYKKLRLRLYTPRLIQSLPRSIQKVIPYQCQWTRQALARELTSSPPDYFLTPAYFIPKTAPKNSFSVIHDVVFKTKPQLYKSLHRKHLNFATFTNIKRSKKIITISQFSKQEIMREYGIDENKISVVPVGYTKKTNIFNSDIQRQNQILYVGRIEAKKSLDILIKAFAEFIGHNHSWKLVLAGKLGYKGEEIKKLIQELKLEEKVDLLGYVSEAKKWELLKSSKILVHPSKHEGSCIPLFEAWNAQIPAIVADISVMHEIPKDGALYFVPGDAKDLECNISELAVNNTLREYLIKKGQTNLVQMSWEKRAQDILEVILGE